MPSALFEVSKFTFGLGVLLFGYTIFGAFVYMQLEREPIDFDVPEIPKYNIEQARETMLQMLNRNAGSKNWIEDARIKLEAYEYKKKEAEAATSEDPWDFIGSIIFSITVYTSIGYGHIAPASIFGKIFTMVYAFFGIPLCLIYLTELGKLITKAIKAFHAKIRPEADVDEEFNFSFVISFAICIIYLFGGAFMYCLWEDWSYLDAVYFVFISTSTVGFGDYLPTNHHLFLLTILYIFIGLSLVSMILNVTMERLIEGINILSEKYNEITNSMSSDLDAIVDPKKEQ